MLDFLQPLDYPRQALANLVRGGTRMASGGATEDDYMGMLPGLLGVGALGLGASPLLAAIVGGLGQAAGKVSGLTGFEAPTTGDLVGGLGGDPSSPVQNIAAQLLTDPLSYAAVGPASRLAMAPWAKEAALADEASLLRKLGGEMDLHMAARQGVIDDTIKPMIGPMADELAPLDLAGIARGEEMARVPARLHRARGTEPPLFAQHEPSVQQMQEAGWMGTNAEGNPVIYGGKTPPGVEFRPINRMGGPGVRGAPMIGKGPVITPSEADLAAMDQRMAERWLNPRGGIGQNMPAGQIPPELHLAPGDVGWMREQMQAGMGLPAPPQSANRAVAENLVIRRLAEQLATQEADSVGGMAAMLGRADPASIPGLMGMGVSDGRHALGMVERGLGRELQRYQITDADLRQLLLGAGAGGYAGGLLGMHGF